jgi:hypothetical protein
MKQTLNGRFEPGTSVRALLVMLFMTTCVLWLYRMQLMNGFSLLSGDRYDAVISTTILEHWYNVFQGKSHWTDVQYFYPHVRSIANTDGYFLVGLLYIPFRLFQLDPFLSGELAIVALKVLGFVGMYWMSRRVFSLPFHWSILAAVLFTLNNGMTTHSSRSQFATVAVAPFMTVLLWRAVQAVKDGNFSKFRWFGALAGLLFGAWCISCFYVAWFFLYFMIVFSAIAFLCARQAGWTLLKNLTQRHAGSCLFVLAVALIALGPFLYAYLPKSRETGVRDYSDALQYTVMPENILQLGNENLFLGKIYNAILLKFKPDYVPAQEYYNTGFGIFLFGLFAAACIHIYRQERKDNKFILALMLATVVTWLTPLNIGGHSLWYFVFNGIPGAKALRIVSAYYIFLALPIIAIAVRYFSRRRFPTVFASALVALLIVEELNVPGLSLTRNVEMERIAMPHQPPASCRAFYTSGWADQTTLGSPAELYAHNVTAMLIAQQLNIPTVNGFASFMAPDWDFAYPERSDYDSRVRSYAFKNNVQGLCRFDLNDKTWAVVDPKTIRKFPMALPFLEKSTWDGGIAAFSGLSGQEAWGRWSEGKVVQFDFTDPLPPKFALHLTGHAYTRNTDKDFVAILHAPAKGNGLPSGTRQAFALTSEDAERVMQFDNPSGLHTLSIIVPEPVSPMELGSGTDKRKIGLGLVKIKIVPL